MTPESADLLARLEAFQFEPGFVGRLAHENGWPLSHAERACLEYKRFVFLALAAGHPCAPSDGVDQVWHLHVLHTQDYWEHFCGQVLRAPLHHQPARGAAREGERFRAWYQNTLASYRRCFGAAAPPALWPAPDCYLEGDFQRADRRRVWLIPKPRWLPALARMRLWPGSLRSPKRALALAFVSLAVAGCSLIQQVPPFDLPGPTFLLVFIASWALSLLAIMLMRGLSSAPVNADRGPLHAYELAYLAGGEWQVAQAVIAAMVQQNQLRIRGTEGGLSAVPHARASHPLEVALLQRCAQDGEAGTAPAELRPVVVEQCTSLALALEAKGFLFRSSQRRAWLLLALLAPALGVVKIGVGLALGRPVLFLVLLCAVAAVVAWRWLSARRQITPAGRALLAELRQESSQSPAAISADVPVANLVALFGVGVLADSAFSDVERMLGARAARASTGTWGSRDSSGWSGSDHSWGSSDSSSSDSSGSSSCSSDSGSSGCSSGSSSGCGGCSSSSSSSSD